MKKRVSLTGASGTVGREVLKQLIKKDAYDITVFDIETKRSQHIFSQYKNAIKVVYGDISQKSAVEKIAKEKDFVIHLAAIIPPLADENPNLAYQVNVVGTQNLLSMLSIHLPKAFFIYASSISIYGDRIENPYIKVGDALIPSIGDEYAKTKIACEKNVQQSNLEWTIFRLAAIMGYGNHKISELMFHMPLETPMEICTPEDTARAFVNAVENREKLAKTIFNLGGGVSCRILYEDFLQRSFYIYGLGKLNFPDKAFAKKNFHCGYYADGDKLEERLNFRQDTIETFFAKFEKSVPKWKSFFASIFKGTIKKILLKKSEPYLAWKNNNEKLKKRFFGVV